jgi:hypothetical protein
MPNMSPSQAERLQDQISILRLEYFQQDQETDLREAIIECIEQALAEAERRGCKKALAKVAQDWRERGFRTHDEIQAIEVQAFLDSRHVHYPECWEGQP